MFLQDKLSHHQNAFMALVGVVSALLNAMPFLALAHLSGTDDSAAAQNVSALIAVSAFFTYARFRLLVSARTGLWMLGQGVRRWFNVLFVALAGLLFLSHGNIDFQQWRAVLVEWIGVSLVLQVSGLAVLRRIAYNINNSPSNKRRAVFFSLGPKANELAMRLQRSPILGIHVDGYYAPQPLPDQEGPGNTPRYLGDFASAIRQIDSGQIDIAFIPLDKHSYEDEALQLMNRLYDSTTTIYLIPESPIPGESVIDNAVIAGVPLLALHETQMVGLSRSFKRATDLVLGSMVLVLVMPVMLLVALAIRLDSPGPIIFRQHRYGERGSSITVFKFRSMRVGSDRLQDGKLRQASANDDRITRVGRILRRTSLDELPQLFNVLGGSMSLVGPRPHAAEHNEMYRRMIHGYMLRHSVKPGITGWAQIHGLRGETDTPDKMQRRVQYDRYYITNWSLRLDLKILVRTTVMILWDRNAY
ncbi:capsular polysaccharide biosynthesis glucosyltransferase [Bordetella ansorpii]|uniref:Capsular polysaccharide biosynthesis glucosyltransferase n=1 Tax=Bordetella ansorpii TaxID=288768 RepID=A0A157KAQ6_9BORD|nr:undecaprenyl-phosphate glucose phosphotransferase [Bordetella ansorpii]SAH81256.1 capsular polysaccharide biosynthesis glucosyltransferase [Bordetella ansorpii]